MRLHGTEIEAWDGEYLFRAWYDHHWLAGRPLVSVDPRYSVIWEMQYEVCRYRETWEEAVAWFHERHFGHWRQPRMAIATGELWRQPEETPGRAWRELCELRERREEWALEALGPSFDCCWACNVMRPQEREWLAWHERVTAEKASAERDAEWAALRMEALEADQRLNC